MSAEETFRAFISIDLAGKLELNEVTRALKGLFIQQNIVAPELIHLSLKFLGDITVSKVNDLLEKMRSAVEGIAPFDLTFKGLGAFPKPDNPRVIWIGVIAPENLELIAKRIEDGCADLGFKKEERPFSPHITLSRVKFVRDRQGLPELFGSFQATEFGKIHVEAIRLKKSILGPKGPKYSTMGEVSLTSTKV
jgi:RNA 2',3'-cyclic 3'-phosphodiesterase